LKRVVKTQEESIELLGQLVGSLERENKLHETITQKQETIISNLEVLVALKTYLLDLPEESLHGEI
jgi:hypothetical protein